MMEAGTTVKEKLSQHTSCDRVELNELTQLDACLLELYYDFYDPSLIR